MIKVIFFIFFSSCLYSQTISVRGVNLTYDDVKHTMTLTIPEDLLRVKNNDEEIEIIISKSFSLTINGKIKNPFFEFKGYKKKDLSACSSTMPSNCKEIEKYKVYEFPDIIPDEYILQVSNVFADNKRLNKQSGSLIIQ